MSKIHVIELIVVLDKPYDGGFSYTIDSDGELVIWAKAPDVDIVSVNFSVNSGSDESLEVE
jgi:hypothetical protein